MSSTNSKFKVEEINPSDDQMLELTKQLRRVKKNLIIRRYMGGVCFCGSIPTKKVVYDVGEADFVEWYCDPCYEKNRAQLDKRLENMNFT